MNTMSYKGFQARIEFDSEDEIFTGRIAGIQDIVGFHGDSVTALKSAFHEAVDDYIETCATIGKAPQKPYSGKVMFRIDPETHRKAVIAAELKGKSLNQWAEEVLARAVEEEERPAETRLSA
ncbi:type II toxin-antitoxin system HicB family antitoxin [Hoeflea olei]|uniref:Antitoxin HicB n=1 Tax=Hoeflea olei TaxID=1480615 RepID=A0A1C1YSW8_9HYPH|nr:type II toxin-antitoxin system HicB family antitoxin [Hoeflea olei]OCW56629.1 antitoxin HicB [Hoeflea olei]